MEGDYELVLTHGAGTLIIDQSMPYVEGDPLLVRNENRPQTLTFQIVLDPVDARNLMSPSCSLWSSGTGALRIGDRASFRVYPTSTRAKTWVFYGQVHEIAVKGDNVVAVTCREDWAQYETLQRDAVIFDDHKDLVYKSTTTDSSGRTVIQGLTESDIALPLSVIELMSEEHVDRMGGAGTDSFFSIANSPAIAQRFMATGRLIAIKFSAAFRFYPADTDLYVRIFSDNNGVPGTVLRTITISSASIPRDETIRDYWIDLGPMPMDTPSGRYYWFVVFRPGDNSGATYLRHHTAPDDVLPGHDVKPFRYSTDGTTWTPYSSSNSVLCLSFYYGDYERQGEMQQSLSGTALTLHGEPIIRGLPASSPVFPPSTIQPYRARVSYYHGLRRTKDIMESLLAAGTCSSSVITTREVKIYKTKGKGLADCLRELCDLRDASGAYVGSQLAIAQWTDSTQVLVRRRKHLGDAPSFTFSYGADTSVDNERRIIAGGVKLSKTTRLKPTKVKVLGRASGGLPLVAVVHDKATAGLSAKLGYDVEETLQDDSLQTLEDCRAYGKAYLDSVRPSYDAWEGQLSVAGVYPDLFDLNVASDTYGSGQIITLNYSPLGISGLKAKVKGIRVMGTKTEITLSSEDILVNNRFSDVAWRAARSESFISPTDAESNVVIEAYSATPRTGPAQLGLIANQAVIPGHIIVPCTVTDDAELNLRTIHAEVEAANGSTLPTAPITHVGAYNASNGYLWDVPVAAAYKWKTTRVILEITCRLS